MWQREQRGGCIITPRQRRGEEKEERGEEERGKRERGERDSRGEKEEESEEPQGPEEEFVSGVAWPPGHGLVTVQHTALPPLPPQLRLYVKI